VIRLDPSRENAWRRLGYKKHEGRWISDAQLAAQNADAEVQRQADRRWKPLLERCKAMLDQPSRRAEAEEALAAVSDPRAVPSIGRVFGSSGATQPRAAQLLGQIDAPAASKALAILAIFARSAEARRVAAETLRGRDAREYADLLIALIRDPIKYEVKPVGGPGSPGVLSIEGQKANLQRLYDPVSPLLPGDVLTTDRNGAPVIDRVLSQSSFDGSGGVPPRKILGMATLYQDLYGSYFEGMGALALGPDAFGLNDISAVLDAFQGHGSHGAHHQGTSSKGKSSLGALGANLPGGSMYFNSTTMAEIPVAQVIAETQRSALASQQQLQADVDRIEGENKAVRDRNDRAVAILNGATGQKLPADRKTWNKWWVDQLGYALVAGQTTPNPTIVEFVPSNYQPQLLPSNVITTQTLVLRRYSCFGAGTAVQTLTGPRPIESLQVGDRVLTQSIATGALGYRPILVVHHNPPSPTFLIHVAGDTIVSSPFHRFWKAGKGWVMARGLKAGDRLRTLEGVAEVTAVEDGKVQPVFNLDVAEDADFFAGKAAALVHDNTLPDPRLVPFDAAPVAVARRGE
jgi:hypothetical protein